MGIVLHAIMNIIHLRSFVGIHITWDSAVYLALVFHHFGDSLVKAASVWFIGV